MPERKAPSIRRRLPLVLAVVGLLGFGGGAAANQVVKRLVALPDDAEPIQYVDAEVPAHPTEGEQADHPEEGPAPSTPAPTHTRTLGERQYADIIVRRNIFDSTAVWQPEPDKVTDGTGECKSDSNVRLLATVVADMPDYSSALIAIGGARDSKIDGYAMGQEVGGEGRITLIEQKKVCLDGGTCLCIGTDTGKLASAAPSDKPAGEDGGVEKLSDTKFAVDSSVIQDGLNNFDQLATQVRVVPHKGSDGQIDGYRLSAIRRGSLFDKLGIKNGDIVHGVNGQALNSTEAAMATYQSLRNERSFTFDITRRNQRQTLEYEVK